MKAFVGSPSTPEAFALHDLGEVSIMGESSQFSPEDLVQKETRTIKVKVAVWEKGWQENYNLLTQLREALNASPNLKLVEDDHTFIDSGSGNTVTVTGETVLNRQVQLVDSDLPESWGAYQQEMNLTFRFDQHGWKTDSSDHLAATFQKDGAVSALTLGNVLSCEKDYKSTRYSEMRDIRSRAAGTITLTGEFQGDTTTTVAQRRTALLAVLNAWDAQIDGKRGTLTYGPSGTRFFNKMVRVDSFVPKIDQAVNGIKWTLTASYTIFPDEATYAAAEFATSVSEEPENGDKVLQLTGEVGAATEIIAAAKLASLRTAVLAAQGFTTGQQIKAETNSKTVDADDGSAFLTLSFSETYRKRLSGIESYTLSVTDAEDAKTGFITRTYSGGVVASGSTADAAYTAGVTKARELGDNKHPFRLSGRTARMDRRVKGDVENMRVEFEFSYQVKATRIYLEMQSETSTETFGDTTENVTGFITAPSSSAARAAYATLVRDAYNGRLVRSERLSDSSLKIANGDFGSTGAFTASSGFAGLYAKLEFSFNVWKAKDTGFYAIRYGVKIDHDYVGLKSETTCSGTFFGTEALITAAHAGTAGNKLDEFLEDIIPGGSVKRQGGREYSGEQIGDSISGIQSLSFNETYEGVLSTAAQVLSSEVSEQIKYSSTRWVFGAIPDGPSVPMNCGTEPGSRTVSGSVLAATEAAAMGYVDDVRQLAFPSGVGGGTAPATRYTGAPEITRTFEFLPLTEGDARGTPNYKVVRVNFNFPEVLLNYPYTS